ncbi:MAG: multiheme c-type cytochrome [Planctomycetota bacterium]|nr:multiheme c-type cytochrome [Planctomycetota bacterium]
MRIQLCAVLVAGLPVAAASAQAFGPRELSEQSKQCVQCHKEHSPALYEQWGSSKHFRANVACFECHSANKDDPDAYTHYGQTIAILVTPKDCARCHSKEFDEFTNSHHAKAGRILGSLDNTLAEVVEGNHGFKTPGAPEGRSAAAVSGCWACHGSEVKVLPDGKLDATTWPNSGIGRLNPDGSEGTCNSCHTTHAFSTAQARHPDTCGKCHLGPDHPQKEIYEESKHGSNFFANVGKMNLDNPKWVVGEDYHNAPTCATCHMSATRKQGVTHDVGLRISWNNRPEVSIRPEVSDAKLGLPSANIPWQTRRKNMTDVCINCHDAQLIGNFYTQYDAFIDLYNTKFGTPGKELYTLAKPLLNPVQFTNELDFTWYEIWHHEGRRARHGVSMMAPDYAHWHGTYEVAKHFYSDMVPQLRHLIDANIASSDPKKAKAAADLKAKLESVLNSDDHKWYLGKMDADEAEQRKQSVDDFKKRYQAAPSAPAAVPDVKPEPKPEAKPEAPKDMPAEKPAGMKE